MAPHISMNGVCQAIKDLNTSHCTPTSIRKYMQQRDSRFQDMPSRLMESRIKLLAHKGLSNNKLARSSRNGYCLAISIRKRKKKAAGKCRRHIPKRPYCSFYKKRCCRVKRESCRGKKKGSCSSKKSRRK